MQEICDHDMHGLSGHERPWPAGGQIRIRGGLFMQRQNKVFSKVDKNVFIFLPATSTRAQAARTAVNVSMTTDKEKLKAIACAMHCKHGKHGKSTFIVLVPTTAYLLLVPT